MFATVCGNTFRPKRLPSKGESIWRRFYTTRKKNTCDARPEVKCLVRQIYCLLYSVHWYRDLTPGSKTPYNNVFTRITTRPTLHFCIFGGGSRLEANAPYPRGVLIHFLCICYLFPTPKELAILLHL